MHLLQDAADFTGLCRSQDNGMGNVGVIQMSDYLIESTEDLFIQVYNSSDQSKALLKLGMNTSLIDTEQVGLYVNRYLRYTADEMTVNFLSFMQDVNSSAVNTFIGIIISIFTVLVTLWIMTLKKLQKWLNDTKRIYIVLPAKILENNNFIRNYFKKELKNSKRLCF